MSEVMENICSRRSIRAFTDQEIAREDLDTLVKAAMYAPSGMGRQSRQITVVQNPEKIAALAACIRSELGRDGYDLYRPNALIMLSDETENTNGLADCACSLENIFLAAADLGIGSVWINQLKEICRVPEVRKVLNDLQIPADHTVWGMAALGYAAEEPKEKKHQCAVQYVF